VGVGTGVGVGVGAGFGVGFGAGFGVVGLGFGFDVVGGTARGADGFGFWVEGRDTAVGAGRLVRPAPRSGAAGLGADAGRSVRRGVLTSGR
jgi:hypothetical protein